MTALSGLTLHAPTARDENFLFQLYASTRAEELAPLGWSAAEREAFLRQQFAAQRSHYRTAFPDAVQHIVVRNKQPIGALIVHRTPFEIRVVDLALLPRHRGAGIGTQLLENVMAQAREARLPLRLQVLKTNPAARLYRRLGFAPVSENGFHLQMEWRA